MPIARRIRSDNRTMVTDSSDEMDLAHQRSTKVTRKSKALDAATVHFFDHEQDPSLDECHWCQLRLMPKQKTCPITVVNTEDNAELPADFKFITEMVLGDGVWPAEDSFRSGCSCRDFDDCQYAGCHCLGEIEEDDGDGEDDEEDDESSDEEKDKTASKSADRMDTDDDDAAKVRERPSTTSNRRKCYSYYTHGVQAGRLRSRMLNSNAPLYECHSGCSCPPSCPNRVVERGRTVPLEIFRTTDRGWGVRSRCNIKQGQFVDQYLGEIITSEEADRRRTSSKRKDVYLFALDKFTDPNSYDPRLRGPPLEVDGEFMSGPTRFINHSCDPNLRPFARLGDHADKHIHDLALFAIRDILAGEELTFDYVNGAVDDDEDSHKNQENLIPCLCRSSHCRGYLW